MTPVSIKANPRDKEGFPISTTAGVTPNCSRLAASVNPAIPAPTIRIRGLPAPIQAGAFAYPVDAVSAA